MAFPIIRLPEPQALPTFDEWYETKHGGSFDDLWGQPHMRIDAGMRELARALRDYATDMATLKR